MVQFRCHAGVAGSSARRFCHGEMLAGDRRHLSGPDCFLSWRHSRTCRHPPELVPGRASLERTIRGHLYNHLRRNPSCRGAARVRRGCGWGSRSARLATAAYPGGSVAAKSRMLAGGLGILVDPVQRHDGAGAQCFPCAFGDGILDQIAGLAACPALNVASMTRSAWIRFDARCSARSEGR